MKTNYDSILINLKKIFFQLGEEKLNINTKNKVLSLIHDVEKLKKKQKKEIKYKKINNNFNFISKDPKKSIEVINDLIQKEENQSQREIINE